MANTQKNLDYKKDVRQTVRRIVDDFIGRNQLPEVWGHDQTSRTVVALKIVDAACNPQLIASLDRYDGAGKEVPLQIDFSCAFAKDPDYFIRLVSFARKSLKSEAVINKVITELRDGKLVEELTKQLEGRTPTDKEIAVEIMKLRGLNFNFRAIGDARRQMIAEDEAIKDNNIARHMENDEYQQACRAIYGDDVFTPRLDGQKPLVPLIREYSPPE